MAVGAQPCEQLIGVQEPQCSKHPQEACAFAGEGRKEGDDGDHVGPCRGLEKIADARAAYEQARGEIGENGEPEETSIASSSGVRSAKDDATMKRMVAVSNMQQGIAKAVRGRVLRLRKGSGGAPAKPSSALSGWLSGRHALSWWMPGGC